MQKSIEGAIEETGPWKFEMDEGTEKDLFLSYDFATMYRKLILTSTGMIGSGPPAMNPGDLVCILQGSETPIILRRQGKFYRLVGAAYVSGIMEREAVTEWEGTTVFFRHSRYGSL
jgi:hypothetical protein